jgi:hypothetical protein
MTDNTSEPEEVDLVAAILFAGDHSGDSIQRISEFSEQIIQDGVEFGQVKRHPDEYRELARKIIAALRRPAAPSEGRREAGPDVLPGVEVVFRTRVVPNGGGVLPHEIGLDTGLGGLVYVARKNVFLAAAPDPSSQGGEDRGSVGSKILPVASPADRETLGRAIYLERYEADGADWEANESKHVWFAKADRVISLMRGATR